MPAGGNAGLNSVVTELRDAVSEESACPAYGNDAAVLDTENDLLYVGSWAHGEVDVLDLKARAFVKQDHRPGDHPPHVQHDPRPEHRPPLVPRGATAVNGTFGAALCALDPRTEKLEKVRTGWAPIDLVELPGKGSFLVFDCEDRFAEVRPDGSFRRTTWSRLSDPGHSGSPRRCPSLLRSGWEFGGRELHQDCFWRRRLPLLRPPPVLLAVRVTWDAKNGVLSIDAEDLGLYDRRIPGRPWKWPSTGTASSGSPRTTGERRSSTSAPSATGCASSRRRAAGPRRPGGAGQDPEEFLVPIPTCTGSTSRGWPSGTTSRAACRSSISPPARSWDPLGRTVTDLLLSGENLYAANFDSRSVTVIDHRTLETRSVAAGEQPLRLAACGGRVWALHHGGRSLQEIGGEGKAFPSPAACSPTTSSSGGVGRWSPPTTRALSSSTTRSASGSLVGVGAGHGQRGRVHRDVLGWAEHVVPLGCLRLSNRPRGRLSGLVDHSACRALPGGGRWPPPPALPGCSASTSGPGTTCRPSSAMPA